MILPKDKMHRGLFYLYTFTSKVIDCHDQFIREMHIVIMHFQHSFVFVRRRCVRRSSPWDVSCHGLMFSSLPTQTIWLHEQIQMSRWTNEQMKRWINCSCVCDWGVRYRQQLPSLLDWDFLYRLGSFRFKVTMTLSATFPIISSCFRVCSCYNAKGLLSASSHKIY